MTLHSFYTVPTTNYSSARGRAPPSTQSAARILPPSAFQRSSRHCASRGQASGCAGTGTADSRKMACLCSFADEPVAEIVQCGGPAPKASPINNLRNRPFARIELPQATKAPTTSDTQSPLHFALASNMDTNIVSKNGFRKYSIFDRRPRTGGNRTSRGSFHVGKSRRQRECEPGFR